MSMSIQDEFQEKLMLQVKKTCDFFEEEKKKLLIGRIKEYVNEDIDFIEETKKRFPRIKSEYNGIDMSEHYYWNDGSENGLHLISFYRDAPSFESFDSEVKLGFKYSVSINQNNIITFKK